MRTSTKQMYVPFSWDPCVKLEKSTNRMRVSKRVLKLHFILYEFVPFKICKSNTLEEGDEKRKSSLEERLRVVASKDFTI